LRYVALFSFEGMNSLRASSFSALQCKEIAGEFLENCIEKNFHVFNKSRHMKRPL